MLWCAVEKADVFKKTMRKKNRNLMKMNIDRFAKEIYDRRINKNKASGESIQMI